jgi:RNA polymerase sigma-70 factor (ECF subfamily)
MRLMMRVSTEQAWREMSQKLHGFFRRRVDDDQLAQDLVQDTFLRIHNNIDTLQDQERLTAWVYRIAASILADHFRKGFVSKEILTNDITLVDEYPEENYNEKMAGWLGQMVQNLPATYRDAVALAELEGVTQRQISDRLGISLSGAKSRVQRGREKLKDQLLQCCHVELDRRGNVTDYQPRAGCHGCCAASPGNTSCRPREADSERATC